MMPSFFTTGEAVIIALVVFVIAWLVKPNKGEK